MFLSFQRSYSFSNIWNKETYLKAKNGIYYVINEWIYDTKKVDPKNKAVLITGCDKGFGYFLAKRLDFQGFHVFASCLFPTGAGAVELKNICSNKLQVLNLDVTKDEAVEEAVKYVKNNLGSSKLWAVVNNAGIQKGFSLEFTNIKDYADCLDVNALGIVRVSKAFLPMLRESKGRIVNLTSILGRFGAPHGSPYVMSKFAASGLNDSIRNELDVWGVRVICVEPELFGRELMNIDKVLSSPSNDIKSIYGEEYMERLKRYVDVYMSFASPKIHLVLNALEAAVTLERPWPVYRPTRNFFTKCLFWIYETNFHVTRDMAVRFFLYLTGFPKPNSLMRDEKNQLRSYSSTMEKQSSLQENIVRQKNV